jgi:Fe-S-cluster-containing hydrogenase component 2
VAIKCDLCGDFGEPQCVRHCYPGALKILQAEKVGLARARAKSEKFLEMARREA